MLPSGIWYRVLWSIKDKDMYIYIYFFFQTWLRDTPARLSLLLRHALSSLAASGPSSMTIQNAIDLINSLQKFCFLGRREESVFLLLLDRSHRGTFGARGKH